MCNVQGEKDIESVDSFLIVNSASGVYTYQPPMYITSNVTHSFSKYGLSGTGAPEDPWIIENFFFYDDTSVSITIEDTSDTFIIRNCIFNDGNNIGVELDGIFLKNVQHGTIQICLFTNVRHGIIAFDGCSDITIRYNIIHHTSESGIRIKDSNTFMIYGNTIHDIGQTETLTSPWGHGNGIWLRNSYDIQTTYNTVYDVETGIWIMNSAGLTNVSLNTVYGTSTAILANSSGLSLIKANSIFDPAIANPNQVGIMIKSTTGAFIDKNTIIGCILYGLMIDGISVGTEVHDNSFVRNNQGRTSQAMCNTTTHGITNNYWLDWTFPDEDKDGFVDYPYPIDGYPDETYDPSPRTEPQTEIDTHFIGDVILIHPNGGEIVGDSVEIEWTEVYDTLGHPFTYDIYYSDNNGTDWTPIISGLTNTSYFWNTTIIPRGDDFLVNVTAFCSEGLKTTDVSDDTFTLVPDMLTPPTVQFPNGGESVYGTIEILWSTSNDTWHHSINYSVYLSSDSGGNWTKLAGNLTVTSHELVTTSLAEGDYYLVKVIAECSNGITIEDQSNDVFSVYQHSVTTPTVLYPNGNEIINGSVTIHWTASVGSFGHPILYTVEYSPNNGQTWINIDAGIGGATTSLFWNTTNLDPGTTYLVRVEARCSEGKRASDRSDNPFILQEHYLSIPNVIYPDTGVNVRGLIYVDWSPSFDSWNYNVSYMLYYSADGIAWFELASTGEEPFFLWDTIYIADGSYALKVVSSVRGGVWSEDTTGFFDVQNLPTTTSMITTTLNVTFTSTTTMTYTSETTPTSSDNGMILVIIGIGVGGVVVVVILIFWMRSRKS